jgi:hypothetical protein
MTSEENSVSLSSQFLMLQTAALINERLSRYLGDLVKQGQLRLRNLITKSFAPGISQDWRI